MGMGIDVTFSQIFMQKDKYQSQIYSSLNYKGAELVLKCQRYNTFNW